MPADSPLQTLFGLILRVARDLILALLGGLLRAPGALVKPHDLTIRRAAPAEVIDLRHRVLRDGQPRSSAIFPMDDHADTRHWIAAQGGRIVGVVTVLRSPWPGPEAGPGFQLRGMATAPEVRGSGVGAALLQAVEREVAAPLWCNARVTAAGFYRRHGWRSVGEEFVVQDIGPHVRMIREEGA